MGGLDDRGRGNRTVPSIGRRPDGTRNGVLRPSRQPHCRGYDGLPMADVLPLRALLLTVTGLVHREQQRTIESLIEENGVLKGQLGGRRRRLTDDQRRRLAAKGRALGRRLLGQVATIVTPDTILRWRRRLIAAKRTYAPSNSGRNVRTELWALVVRLARENSTWGYSRMQGAIGDLGHTVGRTTVARILRAEGIKPAPDRPSSLSAFIKATWGTCAAADFFTTELWTPKGLRTFYKLFVIDLATRRVEIVGTTKTPDESFMLQAGRNLLDVVDGFLRGHRALIIDRDTKLTRRFRELLASAGVEAVRIPARSPNCNAYAERFVRSIKAECLSRRLFFGEASPHPSRCSALVHGPTARAPMKAP